MKKLSYLCFLCILILTLVGCSSVYEVSIGIGDGSIPLDEVRCYFKINEKIKDNYVIEGKISAEKEAKLDTSYVFAISFTDPLMAESYEEHVLLTVKKEDLEALKTDSGYGPFKFKIKLNELEKLFAKDGGKKVYFIFHKENWKQSDILSYGSSSYSYKWNNNSIILTK